MSATLTQRYVHATVRDLPAGRRDDVARELQSTIEDMVEAHVSTGLEPPEAERAALVALGHPAVLAAGYAGGPQHLIGPRFYGLWWRLTRTLLIWVPLTIACLSALSNAVDTRADSVGSVVGAAVLTALTSAVQIAFWTTAVFALIERFAAADELTEFSPDALPELSEHDGVVSLGDAALGALFNLILAGLIIAQHFRTGVGEHGDIPLLAPELWGFWLPLLVAGCVGSAGLEMWRYRSGWTPATFAATVLAALVTAGPIAWLAQEHRLLNRDFVDAVNFTDRGLEITMGIVLAAAVVIGLYEITEAAWRTFIRRTPPASGR
jgi:hypothetical protein